MKTTNIILSKEDYINLEPNYDIRQELINETLIEMPGDNPIHNYTF